MMFPQKLIYHFVHPNGAIQSVNGPMMSGGKDPAILPAFGSVDLTEPIHPASNTVQWYCPERVSTSSNFLASPLSDTQSFSGSNIIASKGKIMGYDKFFDLRKTELELKYGTTTLMKTRRLKDNKIELYYLYPVPYTSLNARTVQTFDAADGGFVTVEQLYVKVDNGASNATQAYAFMKYDKDGNFVDVYGIGNLIGGANRELISLKDDKLSMLVYTRGVNNSTTLKFIDLDLSEFSVQTALLPEGEYLINDKAYHYDASAGAIYFLTQQRLGKGLSLYWHKL